jgi:hypothetical protein
MCAVNVSDPASATDREYERHPRTRRAGPRTGGAPTGRERPFTVHSPRAIGSPTRSPAH